MAKTIIPVFLRMNILLKGLINPMAAALREYVESQKPAFQKRPEAAAKILARLDYEVTALVAGKYLLDCISQKHCLRSSKSLLARPKYPNEFKKILKLVGTGYKAQLQGKILKINAGYSHDIVYEIPEGINVKCPDAY